MYTPTAHPIWEGGVGVLYECASSLNTSTSSSADRKTMHRLFIAQIRTKVDFGLAIYEQVYQSYLRLIDPIQNEGIRITTGTFHLSPKESEGEDWSDVLFLTKRAAHVLVSLHSDSGLLCFNSSFRKINQ